MIRSVQIWRANSTRTCNTLQYLFEAYTCSVVGMVLSLLYLYSPILQCVHYPKPQCLQYPTLYCVDTYPRPQCLQYPTLYCVDAYPRLQCLKYPILCSACTSLDINPNTALLNSTSLQANVSLPPRRHLATRKCHHTLQRPTACHGCVMLGHVLEYASTHSVKATILCGIQYNIFISTILHKARASLHRQQFLYQKFSKTRHISSLNATQKYL